MEGDLFFLLPDSPTKLSPPAHRPRSRTMSNACPSSPKPRCLEEMPVSGGGKKRSSSFSFQKDAALFGSPSRSNSNLSLWSYLPSFTANNKNTNPNPSPSSSPSERFCPVPSASRRDAGHSTNK
ncbi:hypothetical protein QOT17_009207 [Balamuthia mandrillaris]